MLSLIPEYLAKRPSRLSGLGYLRQESITLGSLFGSFLALAEISVEALASLCPRTGVPSAVTCFLAWLGVFPTIPSDSTHVFRPHMQVTGSSNSTQRFSPNSPGERVVGAPGFDPLSSDFAVERATVRLRCTPLADKGFEH